jgi:E3 ubiquitin-protein ligase RNF14
MFALQHICGENEFKYIKNTNFECSFSIATALTNENLVVKFITIKKECKEYVKYLPAIRFYVKLSQNYPSTNAPKYRLSINWLTPWEISLVCQKLDELWHENQFNEILFIWYEFLKYKLMIYLNLTDTLDVSFLFNLYQVPTDQFLLQICKWVDYRVINAGLSLNPVEKLLEYNEYKCLLEFESNFYECSICFMMCSGKVCTKIYLCNHIFCNDCIIHFVTIKINEHTVNSIKCPAFDCKFSLKFNQIQEICSTEMFVKYKKYLLENIFINKKNIVYCPRKICQSFVIIKDGENLALCTNCEYNFCVYCFKVINF